MIWARNTATRPGAARVAALFMLALMGSFSPEQVTPSDSTAAVLSAGRASPAAAPLPAEAARPSVQPRPFAKMSISIPSIGIRSLKVLPYVGQADDRPGTRIQNRGIGASPRGQRGGVGPGQIGNLIITAHRLSGGGPFRRLPSLRNGEHILITSDGMIYDYVVTDTLTISFRSARDIARQSAPVPGHLGLPATQPMITLSTCATPEDHARGNYWADKFGNPEHRIDKIGVLVATRAA
jgi:sortase A